MPGVTTVDVNAAEPIAGELLNLAPLHLPNLREDRYLGEEAGVPLAPLASVDKEIIRLLYHQTNGLLAILSAKAPPAATTDALRNFLDSSDFMRLRDDLRVLGRATFAAGGPDASIAKALHDVRGGALTALLLRLDMFAQQVLGQDELRTLFMLARDHGKIMRSAIADLDPVHRQRDLIPQSHHVRLLTEKWHKAVVGPPGEQRKTRLYVDSRFDGAVTECCLESAAIDRVVYNLITNALRHCAGDRLDLLIFQVPAAPGENLRFVLRNAVLAKDESHLRKLAGGGEHADVDLGLLFEPGVSSTGSGYGLAIVADLVTQAYGIFSSREARRRGYFGARLLGGKFTIWFHWPIARDGLGLRPAATDDAEEIPRDLQDRQQHPDVALAAR